jgi:ketosteroid isomerase-like protein
MELEATNNRIEQLYLTEDANALTSLYASQFTFFPEYKPAIFEIKVLNKFFKDWFTVGDVKIYKKKISAVEVYSDYLLELGTFSFHYSSIKNPQGDYKGNYMVLWKRANDGKLSIISETFGADTYIEPEVVPYEDVQVDETNFTAIDNVNKKLIAEIEEFDAVVLNAVANSDANARADGFTNDAILLSNFDSIRVGMENIRPKMLKTYTPNMSYIVKHYYNRIYDLGDYVFVVGQYKGGWGDSTKGGWFEGNMSNLLKRTKNGKLLMHRQAGNRDRKLVLFNN